MSCYIKFEARKRPFFTRIKASNWQTSVFRSLSTIKNCMSWYSEIHCSKTSSRYISHYDIIEFGVVRFFILTDKE